MKYAKFIQIKIFINMIDFMKKLKNQEKIDVYLFLDYVIFKYNIAK